MKLKYTLFALVVLVAGCASSTPSDEPTSMSAA